MNASQGDVLTVARRLYETSGFRAVFTYHGSNGEPLIAMAKRLGATAD